MNRYLKWGLIGLAVGILAPLGFGLGLALPVVGIVFELPLTPPLMIANILANITTGAPTAFHTKYGFIWLFGTSVLFYVGLFLILAKSLQILKRPKDPKDTS